MGASADAISSSRLPVLNKYQDKTLPCSAPGPTASMGTVLPPAPSSMAARLFELAIELAIRLAIQPEVKPPDARCPASMLIPFSMRWETLLSPDPPEII